MKKMNLKYYFIVFTYHKKGYEQKDFVVNETKQGVVATHIHDDMAFFILKLSNGVSIARGFDGYYVPITHIKLNAASDKMIEVKNNVLLAFDKKPKGANRYYRIKDGLVYEGDTNQYFKQ